MQQEIAPTNQMTIRDIAYLEHIGKRCNDAKVRAHIRSGHRYVHIHNREFGNFNDALNYLREDARNVAAPLEFKS